MEVLGNKLDKDRIFDTFAELVSVDSPSGGEYAMAEKLTDMWKRVGVKLEKVPAKRITVIMPGQIRIRRLRTCMHI